MSGSVRAGVVGVGFMGGGIARGLLRAGVPTVVCDRDGDRVAELVAEGADAAGTPAELATRADVVCVVVFDAAQVVEVVLGAQGLVHGAADGTVVCICSTVDIATVEHVHATAAALGVRVLDAGVSGGGHRAAEAGLVTMVGGDADALAVARPVLEGFSKEVLHAGPLGAGMRLKLVKNLVSYLVMCAVHEGMLCAEAFGIPLDTAQHVFETSHLLEDFFHLPAARPSAQLLAEGADPEEVATARFYAETARKDLAGVRAAAEAVGLDLPAAAVAWERAYAYHLVPADDTARG